MRKPRPIAPDVQAAFALFWAAYPVRADNPKKPALVAFAELVARGVEAEALVRAAKAYEAFVRSSGMDRKFVPHARTWLNQERFDDYLTAPGSSDLAPSGPNPKHPLAALYVQVGEAAWRSYFEPTTVEIGPDATVVTTATAYARDKLQRDYGRDISELLGFPIIWKVK